MIEPKSDDPTHRLFWEAAGRHELVIQRCTSCGHYQFYGRPFCLACGANDVAWVPARGTGTIYSMTTVRMELGEPFAPPYIVAIVELDEGPRLTTNIVGVPGKIGNRVRVTWRERQDAPPLPLFELATP